jgi:hypothetical protein
VADLFYLLAVVSIEEGYQPAFPLDLLRVDCLYPASTHDSNSILRSLISGSASVGEIYLKGKHPVTWEPAYERWERAGWKIASMETQSTFPGKKRTGVERTTATTHVDNKERDPRRKGNNDR